MSPSYSGSMTQCLSFKWLWFNLLWQRYVKLSIGGSILFCLRDQICRNFHTLPPMSFSVWMVNALARQVLLFKLTQTCTSSQDLTLGLTQQMLNTKQGMITLAEYQILGVCVYSVISMGLHFVVSIWKLVLYLAFFHIQTKVSNPNIVTLTDNVK